MALLDQGPGVERVGQPSSKRLPSLLVVLAAAFVIVALAKPWQSSSSAGAPDDQATATPRASRSVAPASPTVDPAVAAALGRRQCQSGTGWRLVSVENDGGLRSRTLWDAGPLAPTPGDALSQPFLLWTQQMLAIGYCAPGDTTVARAAHAAAALMWRRLPTGQLQRIAGQDTVDPELAAIGEVYLAPPKSISAAGVWPPGDYLFEIVPTSGQDLSGWFALRVLAATE